MAPYTLPSPPFLAIENANNCRDLGGHAVSPPAHLPSRRSVKREMFYRSAAPTTPATAPSNTSGVAGPPSNGRTLASLRLRTIFDLRSVDELEGALYPIPEGATRLHVPAYTDHPPEEAELVDRFGEYMSHNLTHGYVLAYREILDNAADAMRALFTHIRDYPNAPFLIHCSGGKDRTGVFSAFVLKLAGVPDRAVAADYNLSEVGIPPVNKANAIARMTNTVAEGNMGPRWAALAGGKGTPGVLPDPDAVYEALERLISARTLSMLATLSMVAVEYGGVEGYLKSACGFTEEDIRKMQDNLTSEDFPILH